jgi:predicted alpha/beta-hydrolase family hydrolase
VSSQPFSDTSVNPAVRGFLHTPARANGDGLVFTHGAGGNAKGALLVAVAEVFSEAGFRVLRCDLPFRQTRHTGPPRPGDAARDREGLRNAVAAMRQQITGRVFLGGQSYGGRQATMLCADEPDLADGLFLTSYPLHPPGKPDRLRTEHFPRLRIPALFVEGTKDPFATIEEMRQALKLIPAKTRLLPIEGVGHDLGFSRKTRIANLADTILAEFQQCFA